MGVNIVRLNLGCGLQCPEGWINVDSSFGVKIAKRPVLKKLINSLVPTKWGILPNISWPSNAIWMDITRPFKFKTNSIDYVYSSHTIEHLGYEEATFVFKECFRVMKQGGVFRVIVPDLDRLVNVYLKMKTEDPAKAAKMFHEYSLYFEIPYPKTFADSFKFYFKSKNNHRFLYNEAALKEQLECAGFSNIKRMEYGISEIPGIEKIDIKERFDGAICLEGKKL
jgi:predicted SAM-dependent methyltransferase